MVTSDSAKRASAALHARRKAAGWRKVTIWLDPEAAFKLDAFKAKAGSADRAVQGALKAWMGPGLPKAARQPPARAVAAANAKISEAVANPPPLGGEVMRAEASRHTCEVAGKLKMPRAPIGSRLKGGKK